MKSFFKASLMVSLPITLALAAGATGCVEDGQSADCPDGMTREELEEAGCLTPIGGSCLSYNEFGDARPNEREIDSDTTVTLDEDWYEYITEERDECCYPFDEFKGGRSDEAAALDWPSYATPDPTTEDRGQCCFDFEEFRGSRSDAGATAEWLEYSAGAETCCLPYDDFKLARDPGTLAQEWVDYVPTTRDCCYTLDEVRAAAEITSGVFTDEDWANYTKSHGTCCFSEADFKTGRAASREKDGMTISLDDDWLTHEANNCAAAEAE